MNLDQQIKRAKHVVHYFEMDTQEFIKNYGVQNTTARAVAASAKKLLQALEMEKTADDSAGSE